MTKNIFVRCALVFTSLVALVGVVLTIYVFTRDDDRTVIKMDIADGSTESLAFEHLAMIPGEELEYVLSLDSEINEVYDVTLEFTETETTEDQRLKQFAFVRIEYGNEVICDKLLSAILEDDPIHIPIDLSGIKRQKLTIFYYMPIDVGNEAMGAEAFFDLTLTASNEQ